MGLRPRMNDNENPLVSVCVFNYNYGRYLRQCFDSVLNQTYDNIEICFSDNASTDESWDIAVEYSRLNPGIMTVTRNRNNFGVEANWINCDVNIRGKYYMQLCSDDAIQPDYISKCVKALEDNPNAGFAMVHRIIINEKEELKQEPPFYNISCVIPGPEQAAVYMMAAVNPSVSQVLYNRSRTHKKAPFGGDLAARWYGPRILDFNMCCEYDMIYINEPLLMHRLHLLNDSFTAAENLMEIIGPYVLQLQFAGIATHNNNLSNVAKRLPDAIIKLSNLSLRYCFRAIQAGKHITAKKYYHLSAALNLDICDDEIYMLISNYWSADDDGRLLTLNKLKNMVNFETRNISYDPPPGSYVL